MQREIKFRGKRIDNGEWVYGDTCDYMRGSGKCIMPDSYYATRDYGEEDEKGNPIIEDTMAIGGFIPVIPESVGQYTGLKDSKGVEIYEYDRLKTAKGIIYEVIWSKEKARFSLRTFNVFKKWKDHANGSPAAKTKWLYKSMEIAKDCEVIGTVFENPELINQVK